jgi:uncharacterized membrane protein (DUF373 family)
MYQVGEPTRRVAVGDEGLPSLPPLRSKWAGRLVRTLEYAEEAVYAVVAVLLFVVAVAVLVRTARDLVDPPPTEVFAETITRAVNGILFIVIVLELMRTVIARFGGEGFQLQPFLIIGIISAVRHILTVGAQLSLTGEQAPLTRTMTELGVNAGVVLTLTVSLVLIRRQGRQEQAATVGGAA